MLRPQPRAASRFTVADMLALADRLERDGMSRRSPDRGDVRLAVGVIRQLLTDVPTGTAILVNLGDAP